MPEYQSQTDELKLVRHWRTIRRQGGSELRLKLGHYLQLSVDYRGRPGCVSHVGVRVGSASRYQWPLRAWYRTCVADERELRGVGDDPYQLQLCRLGKHGLRPHAGCWCGMLRW